MDRSKCGEQLLFLQRLVAGGAATTPAAPTGSNQANHKKSLQCNSAYYFKNLFVDHFVLF
jgi:hypothetical protein